MSTRKKKTQDIPYADIRNAYNSSLYSQLATYQLSINICCSIQQLGNGLLMQWILCLAVWRPQNSR